jgi:hypothetical protein
MARWLVIGGAAALVYLLVTSKEAHALQPGAPARPLPQAPPVQTVAPPAQPQTTVVGGASSSFLQDAAAAAGIAGTLADAARKFGLFGSTDKPTATVAADNTGILPQPDFANQPVFASGAAFF